jgi:antitoxin component YwqK of YwqJK toxin-antitoxin module
MRYKIILFFSLVFTINSIFCQSDTVFNQIDKNGLKQGYWKKNFPNGKLMYKGFFKNSKPVGEMRRYYETGELKAILIYQEKTDLVSVKFYYDDGEIASDGFYYNEKKDSLWKYFSYYTNSLTASENYDKGIKNGMEKHFYDNSQLSEEIEWKNDSKDGIWNQYFEDGKLKLRTTYSKNNLNGVYIVYYPNGSLYIVGGYLENKRHGKWVFYNGDGKVKTEIIYNNGKADNEEEIMKKDSIYFDLIEKNLGKFKDPTPDDMMPRGTF